MSIQSEADWRGLRRAGDAARHTLDELERQAKPGVTTAELDAVAATVFRHYGAHSAPARVYGFPGTVLISVNDEIVHGVPGPRILVEGDLVKLDVTVDRDGYVADAARTILLGAAPEPAGRLAACARDAFEAAMAVTRAGVPVNEIGRAVEGHVRSCGFSVVRGLTGHGVGRTIHEPPAVPNHYDRGVRDVLTDGLVITVEPIIAAGSGRAVDGRDGWTIRTRDGSLSAHFEHTLVVTTGRPVLLTAA